MLKLPPVAPPIPPPTPPAKLAGGCRFVFGLVKLDKLRLLGPPLGLVKSLSLANEFYKRFSLLKVRFPSDLFIREDGGCRR